jgi:hypothetical protein
LLAGAGALVALVICFAAGMRAIPRLPAGEALAAVILPLLAAGLAGVVHRLARRAGASGRLWLWTLPPVALSALAVAWVLLTWAMQPG